MCFMHVMKFRVHSNHYVITSNFQNVFLKANVSLFMGLKLLNSHRLASFYLRF